ncbi:hypothetical protein G9A89_021174 [Geosiphon pyriformis]|nr:hypothetical protein G9A89_021174 [Geosiphon pyriformis]
MSNLWLAPFNQIVANKVNSLIAKTVNKLSFIVLGGDFNEDTFDYILAFLSLVNAVINDSVASVEEYFNTNHKAVSTSVSLSGLLDIQLSSMCKQANKNHWKFDIRSFKDATAANVAMFLDEFGLARRLSDLDVIWNIVPKVIIFLANRMFKKKWFKDYDEMFTKESFKLHNLEILVSKIVKASCKVNSGQFESFLKCWVSLNSVKASVVQNLVSSGASLNHSLQAEESGIRSTIKRKMENFMVNKGHIIRSVLEYSFHKVVLDHLVSDGSLILDPVEVKSKVDSIIESWTRKKVMLISVSNLWQCQYLLLDYVNDNAFSGVINVISLDELTHVIKDLLDSKTAGLSGISNKLWKYCDGSVLDLLLDLLNICLVCESVSCYWKEAWVSIIPKLYEWKGVLTNIRLIALIETARKILFKLLFDRISSTCSLFNILCGNNFSVLKSTTTQSPIFAIDLVVENALKKDYMCKAYNSVDWHYLYNSLVQIKMCRCFIRFFGSVHNDRGKVFSSLLWRIFYDSLLCKIKRQKSLCGYHINTKFVARTGRIENQSSLISFLAAGAFYILDTASEFFRVNDISINNKKTVAIPINQRVSDASLLISGLLILVACKKKSYWYLGIYLSSKDLSKPSLAKTYVNIRFFVNLVLKKAILDKQFFYLVSAILQTIVNYRIQFSFISKNMCTRWDTLIRRELRLKAKLPKNFSNETLHYLSLYSLKSFEQLQIKYKLCVSPVNNFLAGVVKIFLDCDMSLNNLSVSAFCFSSGTLISTVLEASLFHDVSFSFKRFGVTFAEQLYTKNGLKLNPRGSVPYWFTLVRDFLTMNVYSSGVVSRLGQCFSSANMRVVSVYTDGLLKDLGLCEMKCNAAAYFSDLGLDIGAKISEMMSLTMAELQAIALALKCVPLNSLVVVYSDSQAILDAYVAESALYKVKGHSGVVDNKHTDELANLVASSFLALSVLVKKKFVRAGPLIVLIERLYPDSHIVTGFTSKSMANLHSYFLKALHRYLLVAVQKHLYSKIYLSVSCLHCGEMKSFNHSFVCAFDSGARKNILESYLAKWYYMLSLCVSNDMLYTTMSKGFVFKDWVWEATYILSNTKVIRKFIVGFV